MSKPSLATHVWLYEDQVTKLELRVELRDGEASFIIGPSLSAPLDGAPEQLIINLLDDELTELHQAIGAEIERARLASSDEDDPAEQINAALAASENARLGDRVFRIEQPGTVHLYDCTLVNLDQGVTPARSEDVLKLIAHGPQVIACPGCSPFGVTEAGGTWVYRSGIGSYWTAKRRLDLVAEATIARRAQ